MPLGVKEIRSDLKYDLSHLLISTYMLIINFLQEASQEAELLTFISCLLLSEVAFAWPKPPLIP